MSEHRSSTPTGQIFLSYRRDDSSGHAGRLYDRLRDHFGPDRVFRDVEALTPGVDFVEAIGEAVGSCDALLAVIGRQWLTATGPSGTRRLDDPADFVRVEIGAALARNVPVVPILVQGAQMPTESDLPTALARLSRYQALEVSESRWDFDVGRLIAAVESLTARPTDPSEPSHDAPGRVERTVPVEGPERSRRSATRIAVPAVIGLVVVAVTAVLLLRPGGDSDSKVATAPTHLESQTSVAGQAEVLFRDDFSGRTGWTVNDDERYASSYVDGAYRVFVKQSTRVVAKAPLDAVGGNVRIGVDAAKLSTGAGEFGLFCRAGSGLLPRYEARIDTDGDWRVAKVDAASGPIQTLSAARDQSEYSRAVRSTGINRIELECAGRQARGATVTLILTVNGQQVAVVEDKQGLPPGQAGLTVQSSAPPMDVRFDNFVVQRT